jgi:predicted Zn-dependent peptidase
MICANRLVAVAAMLTLVLVGGCANVEHATFVTRVLPNGVTIVASENRGSDMVSVHLWVRDGALYESADEAGTAALLRSVMVSSARNPILDEKAQAFMDAGGVVMASLSHDFVYYVTTCHAGHFEEAAELLHMGTTDTILSDEDVESAKQGLLTSLDRYSTSPREQTYLACMKSMMGNHPYTRLPYGSVDVITALTSDDLRGRHRKAYVGRNMIISVAGNVDATHAADVIESLFGDLPEGESAQPAAEAIVWHDQSSIDVLRGQGIPPYIIVGFPAPSASDEDVAAMDLLLMLLGRGRASRLERALILDEELAVSVNAGWGTKRQPNPIMAWVDVGDHDVDAAREAAVDAFLSLADDPIDEDDVARARIALLTEVAEARSGMAERASYQGYWAVVSGIGFVDDYTARINELTREDLERVAKKYFRRNSQSVAIALP